MREHHQRMLSGKREVDFQDIKAVGKYPWRGRIHFLLHQAHLLRRAGLRGGKFLPGPMYAIVPLL